MTPRNASGIIAARRAGQRPADPIVVSFVGALDWSNPTVYADPGTRYDWGFLHDLSVIVAVTADRKPGPELRRILAAEPRTFVWSDAILADVSAQRIATVFLARQKLWIHPAVSADCEAFFA